MENDFHREPERLLSASEKHFLTRFSSSTYRDSRGISVAARAFWKNATHSGATEEGTLAKEDRGFASMDRSKQREIASKGGKAAHQKGTAHEWTSEEAREAGRKGGMASHRRKQEQAGGGQANSEGNSGSGASSGGAHSGGGMSHSGGFGNSGSTGSNDDE